MLNCFALTLSSETLGVRVVHTRSAENNLKLENGWRLGAFHLPTLSSNLQNNSRHVRGMKASADL